MSKRFVAVDDESLNEALDQAKPGDLITMAYDKPNPALLLKGFAVLSGAQVDQEQIAKWTGLLAEKTPVISKRGEAAVANFRFKAERSPEQTRIDDMISKVVDKQMRRVMAGLPPLPYYTGRKFY